jgi:hypothetical protein
MFPYNYVYFNLATRGGITRRSSRPYWGFSLHEAVTAAQHQRRGLKPPVAAHPPTSWRHPARFDKIAGEGISGRRDTRDPIRRQTVARQQPSRDCRTIAEVSRSLSAGHPPLLLCRPLQDGMTPARAALRRPDARAIVRAGGRGPSILGSAAIFGTGLSCINPKLFTFVYIPIRAWAGFAGQHSPGFQWSFLPDARPSRAPSQ